MEKTIEQRTADTITQQEGQVVIGSHTFRLVPPSSATLIEASAAASRLPRVTLDGTDVLSEVIRISKDCTAVGEVVAILLCGAKGAKRRGVRHWAHKMKVRRMTAHLLEDLTPSELQQLAVALLNHSDVSSFFALTAFLVEANLTKPTKAVTTASGQ